MVLRSKNNSNKSDLINFRCSRSLAFSIFSSILVILITQNISLSQPPREGSEYLFPIRPGERNFLAGTMGELRNTHFHGGLDIRTGGRIGLPVYATADGYISRIQVSTGGFGHALYLTHDDGYISVYAHLNLYEENLETYLRKQQYEKETYEIRLYPDKNQFRFRKGDVIAYSGNSGSSLGPHLHFEIRDSEHKFLNPLSFGYTEVIDDIPPILKSIAFTTLDENSRVNNAFGTFDFEVIKVNGKYTTRRPIVLEGNVGTQIYHYDNQNGSWARNGIPEVVYFIDGDTIFHQVKDKMSFNKNRNILAHFDYPVFRRKRRKFNKLFIDDGNDLDIYLKDSRGYFFDENLHELRIILRDNHNNFSEFQTSINNRNIVYPEIPRINDFILHENHLQFKSSDSTATVYYYMNNKKIQPYARLRDENYFLWDLRVSLPDSIVTRDQTIKPDFYVAIPSGYNFNFYNGDFDIQTGRRTLFDTLSLRFEKKIDSASNREIFHFKHGMTPLKSNATITLKPRRRYGEKAAVFSTYGSKINYIGGEKLANGSFQFKTRDLVSYTIAYDSIPPVITPVSWSRHNLKIKMEDEGSGIKKYRATINGQFLLMRYEAKKNLLMAQPRIENKPLSGEFILEVEDFLGNKTALKRKL